MSGRGIGIALFMLALTAAHADVIRPQCQTEESRGLRLISEAMAKAAEEADPWRGRSSMPSVQADAGRVTVDRFNAESRAALRKGRALEAARCPQWERAIMENGPVTNEEKETVAADFDARMEKNWADYRWTLEWQMAHPQCEHVTWWKSYGICGMSGECSKSTASVEDYSGKFEGKKGQCSADGNVSRSPRGTKDSLKMHNPDTNELIAQVACASALQKLKLGEGSYADPKLCAR